MILLATPYHWSLEKLVQAMLDNPETLQILAYGSIALVLGWFLIPIMWNSLSLIPAICARRGHPVFPVEDEETGRMHERCSCGHIINPNKNGGMT